MDTMFRMMRRVTEMRSVPKVGGKVFFPPSQKKRFAMSFAGVTTLIEAKENQKKLKIPPGWFCFQPYMLKTLPVKTIEKIMVLLLTIYDIFKIKFY